jgi:hypothetical protein
MSDTEETPVHAQCFSCKSIQQVQDAQIVKTGNNRLRLSGKCCSCGKSVSKFIRNPDEPAKTTRTISPQKKIQKKRKNLKKCSNCSCQDHNELIESQPKRKRVDGLEQKKKRLQKLIDEISKEEEEKSDSSE